MTKTSDSSGSQDLGINSTQNQTQLPAKSIVIGFYSVAVIFNLCLIAQLLTVGLAYFDNADWWNIHVWLVRGYAGLSVILLVWVYSVSFPQQVRKLTLSLPMLLGLQFLTIYLQTPLPFPLAVVHPLIGFSLFSISTTLVHRVWHIISPSEAKTRTNLI